MSLAADIMRRARTKRDLRTARGYDPRQYLNPWTPEADELVLTRRAAGFTHESTADILGMTRGAVVGRYRRLLEWKAEGKEPTYDA